MSNQTPLLTEEEILLIMHPLTQSAAILRWFKQNGFVDVKKRPNGMPLISRSYFDAITTSGIPSNLSSTKPLSRIQPNFEALRERYGNRAKARLIKCSSSDLI